MSMLVLDCHHLNAAQDTPPDGNDTQENEGEFDISITQSITQTGTVHILPHLT